jgi:hypothetical protein
VEQQVAFFLSGGAVLLSTSPKVVPVVVWIANCEFCARVRHMVAAIVGH